MSWTDSQSWQTARARARAAAMERFGLPLERAAEMVAIDADGAHCPVCKKQLVDAGSYATGFDSPWWEIWALEHFYEGECQ